MTDEQRAALDPSSQEYALRVGGSKTQVLGWSLYTTLLWLLKTCMAVFYSRLTAGLINMKIRVKVAYVLIGVTYIAVICSILFGCHSMKKNWQIYPNPGNYCQPAVSKIDVYVTVILNVATDMYLITIPTPILFKARLPLREKIELLILFSGGTFVMAAGILRCVLILTAGANGASQAGSWACRETFVAVIIGNAPMIYPYMRRAAKTAGIYMTSPRSRSGRSRSGRSQSYPLSDGEEVKLGMKSPGVSQASKKRKFRHPLSLPESQWRDETRTGDEAYMLDMHPLPRQVGAEGFDFPARREGSSAGAVVTSGSGSGSGSLDEEVIAELGGIKVVQETIIERG